MKILMAVTGLILIGFLLLHMYGNLKAFMGAEAFNHYAEWLKGDIFYPLVPYGWFVWVNRLFLLAALVLHLWSAAVLTGRSLAGRGRYQRSMDRRAQTYAARTMRWGGLILLFGLIYHLAQFTVKVATTGFNSSTLPYEMVVATYSGANWWGPVMVIGYAIWMLAVCLHVRHGFASAFATLGLTTTTKSRRVLVGISVFVAVLLFVGFLIMPVSVLVGWVK